MGSPVDRATRRPRGPADSRDVLPGGGAALLGPAFVASIAYVDPGNVATNVAAGAAHGYLLVWVLVAANVLAMLVQYLSAKLGVATGATLPGLCREQYPRPVALGLWAQAELVAIATDLAEVLGGAIALHLLFGIPLLTGGVITGAVSFAVLALQSRRSQRTFEIVITGMLAVILVGFLYSALDAGPAMGGFAGGLVPRLAGVETLLLAAGMLGATVMPHAIYLHSALVRDRHRTDLLDDSQASLARRHRLLTATRVDVVAAMAVAGSVNIAMLLVAAAALQGSGGETLGAAHDALGQTLGQATATLFALALLASGLASSSVGTYAGAVILEGFMGRRISLAARRLLTLVPALGVLALGLEPSNALVLSQVVLSFGIPFAVWPLVLLTRDTAVMGPFVNRRETTVAAALTAAAVTGLNAALLWLTLTG